MRPYVRRYCFAEFSGDLVKLFRSDDVIARIGGDEFMVFMKNIPDESIVKARAKRIIKAASRTFKDNTGALKPSCSIALHFIRKTGKTTKNFSVEVMRLCTMQNLRAKILMSYIGESGGQKMPASVMCRCAVQKPRLRLRIRRKSCVLHAGVYAGLLL